ncbi:hypothetical protein FAZ69_08340 [Trinickia terrae]|uniref:Uncharacterized protein n=1 Tax=Trinickia terrae TaxID=2571161 RepID=A0A4U1I9Q3_9BURK|nr:hypothetical protein [Trinickia terrae]TKC90147.1 hypothetical protein FAZ69_08340 [Trinickia terrae]
MQFAERSSAAQHVVEQLANVSPEFGPQAFGPIVASRVTAMLTAIDAAASTAGQPLLVTDLLPGVDLIVAPDHSQPAQRAPADAPSLASTWDREPAGADWIGALAGLVTAALSQARAGAGEQGAWYHHGGDGLHYFVFDSRDRAQALQQLGVEETDLVMVSRIEEV